MISKNTILPNVEIQNAVAEGKCIAKVDGQVIFVQGVAPGDHLDIKVIRRKKSFLEAIPVHYHQYSSLRQDPYCQHFGTCGGCKWQHIQYQGQLDLKQQQVTDSLQRIAFIENPPVKPIIPAEKTTHYRNKLEFTFSNNRWLSSEEIKSNGELNRDGLGFHIPERFDRILDVEECHLQQDPSNAIRNALRDFALANKLSFFDIRERSGLLRNLIIRNTTLNEVMVIVQFGQEDPGSRDLVLAFLRDRFPQINSLQYVVNTKGNDTFWDLDVHLHSGVGFIEEHIKSPFRTEPLTFRIGPKSFFQTNSVQAERLYRVVAELADLQGHEIIYDLYSGTGTIANLLAARASKVLGIESVPEAVQAAYVNSEANQLSNCKFIAGDIKDLVENDLVGQEGKPDLVVVDPPRAGMHPKVVQRIMELGAAKIIYVSCNPATQARDIALMSGKYSVTTSQPVDMFPHTHHVENVVLLELK